MNEKFKYRETDYFQEDKTYLFYDIALKKEFTSKVHKYNGSWYTKESLQYKCTSIPCYEIN